VRLHPPSSAFASLLVLACLVSAARAEERRTVAVLPVVVHALEEQAYLREGLADMLASRLGQQPGIGVVRVNDPAKATLDADAARAAGRAVGAQWVLYGSFTRFGDGASLDMQCVPVAAPGDPGPRSIFVQSGQIAELIPRLDGVAERVAAHVLGRDGAAPRAGGGAAGSELDELRRRIDALERRAATAATPAPSPGTPP
jgi:outer membrane protein insertion porin family